MKLVLAYGYHRTTMEDVARAAQMSRPALYLLFRNKTDIYRAIAGGMFDRSRQVMQELLRGQGSFGERLYDAIGATMIDMMCEINESPHGGEILDLKSELAGDLVAEWQSGVAGLFRAAIDDEVGRTGVDLAGRGLSAETLAELLVDGLEGIKLRAAEPSAKAASARQLVRVVELSIAR